MEKNIVSEEYKHSESSEEEATVDEKANEMDESRERVEVEFSPTPEKSKDLTNVEVIEDFEAKVDLESCPH